MEPAWLTILRDRETPSAQFRLAAAECCQALLADVQADFKKRKIHSESVVLVVILRSAMAMLPAALAVFPSAPVAVVGLKRDEYTAVAHWYYENVPLITKDQTVIILDPMLATGGSAEQTVLMLKKHGADTNKMHFIGVIAAPEGLARLTKHIPHENVHLAIVDKGLDDRKYIVPGLGDFGDRYFGYQG